MSYYSEIQPISEPLSSAHDYHQKYEDEEGSHENRRKKVNATQSRDAANRARAQILKEKLAQQQEIINNAMMTEQQKNAKVVEEVLGSKEYESERRVKQIEQ